MKKQLNFALERWSEKTRPQSQLSKRWDRSGVVLEDKGFDKYTIKVDGSGRVIDRNRKYLRSFTPEQSQLLRGPSAQTQSSQNSDYTQVDKTPVIVQTPCAEEASPVVETALPGTSHMARPPGGGENSDPVSSTVPVHVPDGTVMSEPVVELRRSTRVRRENTKYSKDLYDLSD